MPLKVHTTAGVLLIPSLIESRLAINHPGGPRLSGTAGAGHREHRGRGTVKLTQSPGLQISQLDCWFTNSAC